MPTGASPAAATPLVVIVIPKARDNVLSKSARLNIPSSTRFVRDDIGVVVAAPHEMEAFPVHSESEP
jgi:hypothetical protein